MYSLLPFVDCLITDYSATYHDYLLSKKPIWFIPYDYSDFKQQNGFLYDYLDYLPGPNLQSYNSLKKELTNLAEGKDYNYNKRQQLCNIIHHYKDGNSSKRVYDLITNLEN